EHASAAEWRAHAAGAHLARSREFFAGSSAGGQEGAPPVTQVQRQRVWDKFNALAPGEVLAEFRASVHAYLDRLATFPAEAGAREIDFAMGKRSIQSMLGLWLNETLLHSWDIYVAR